MKNSNYITRNNSNYITRNNSKFSISKHTRFLIEVDADGLEWVHTTLRGNKNLQEIYRELGLNLWGSVGRDDLLEGIK